MAVQAQPATDASPSPWTAVARAVALLTVAVSVLLTAFAWPSVRSSVHDVPIAVAGRRPRSDRSAPPSTNASATSSRCQPTTPVAPGWPPQPCPWSWAVCSPHFC
jgi:hypothetical protein